MNSLPHSCQGTTGASQPRKYLKGSSSKFSSCCSSDSLNTITDYFFFLLFLFIIFFLEEGSPVLSDMTDQEIIVDSPPPRKSMGQSSGSSPTLPYSHGQAVLPISTFSPLTIPTASFPTSVPQNVTIEHFPLVSSSSNSLYHSSLQPSPISLPDPPPYPSTILLTPLGPTLYGNPFSPIYPHTIPLFGSNPLVGSSLSFPQQSFPSQPTLKPWSFSHTIYNPQPVYTSTSYPFSSNTFSSFSTLPLNTSTTLSNTNPIFITISNTSRSSSDSLPQRRLIRGWPRGWSRGNTYYSTRKPYSQVLNSHTSPFSNIAFSSSNAPWSSHSRYFCPDDPINISTRPRIVNYTPKESSINPFLKSDLSQPKIFSPMVTFNEPSEHVRDMFTIAYSCNFLPGGDHKLTFFIHIKK